MYRLIIILLGMSASAYLHAHGGEKSQEGKLKKMQLEFKPKSNWPVEYCVDIDGKYSLTFAFVAENLTNFDLHFHDDATAAYDTKYYMKNKDSLSHNQKLEVSGQGPICFNWVKQEQKKHSWFVSFEYKLIKL